MLNRELSPSRKPSGFRTPKPIVAVGALVSFSVVLLFSSARAADRFRPIDPRELKLGGEIGERVDLTMKANLLALNVDQDFLRPFKEARETRKGAYIGLGKLIDATVRFAYFSADPQVLLFKDRLIKETLSTQESDGYIGTKAPDQRVWTLWDVHEMSYLVLGLSTDHHFYGDARSLASAVKLADYIITHWSKKIEAATSSAKADPPPGAIGLESAMLALFDETGDRRYLEFSVHSHAIDQWRPHHVENIPERLEGHAYTDLCDAIAQLRLYRIQQKPELLIASHELLKFLTHGNGLTIGGESGDREHWHSTQEGTVNLGETCATAYLIRWLDELLRIDGEPVYGDLLERTVYNGLFAAQSGDGRKIRYYTPFEGPRRYFERDTFCCPNNYRRIVAELPGMVYYRAGSGLVVNLYTPSSASITLDDPLSVKISQETEYPRREAVTLAIEPTRETQFPLQLRIPAWCRDPKVLVNGEPAIARAIGGTFLSIDRTWRRGDRVQLTFPMELRAIEGRQAQVGRVAIMRGPLVYGVSRKVNPDLIGVNLGSLVVDLKSLKWEDGIGRIKGWAPDVINPFGKKEFTLTLSEYTDPEIELVYLKVPNTPSVPLTRDELLPGQ